MIWSEPCTLVFYCLLGWEKQRTNSVGEWRMLLVSEILVMTFPSDNTLVIYTSVISVFDSFVSLDLQSGPLTVSVACVSQQEGSGARNVGLNGFTILFDFELIILFLCVLVSLSY